MTKKYFIFICLVLYVPVISSAQKEIRSDSTTSRKDIQISKRIQGVSVGTEFIGMITRQNNMRRFPVDMDYFREDRIAPTLSMHTFAGINNIFDQSKVTYIDGEATIGVSKAYYNLAVHAGTEFRWHMNYRSRYMKGKPTANNDGWFVGVPLKLRTTVLHQPDNIWHQQWKPEAFGLQADLSIKCGFVHSFTKHLFIESSLQYTPIRFGFDKYDCRIAVTDEVRDMIRLELKAAYTF